MYINIAKVNLNGGKKSKKHTYKKCDKLFMRTELLEYIIRTKYIVYV